mgnify:CR=1 FL=1
MSFQFTSPRAPQSAQRLLEALRRRKSRFCLVPASITRSSATDSPWGVKGGGGGQNEGNFDEKKRGKGTHQTEKPETPKKKKKIWKIGENEKSGLKSTTKQNKKLRPIACSKIGQLRKTIMNSFRPYLRPTTVTRRS